MSHYRGGYMKKYTLDQITDGQYVFLERPEEEVQLLIPKEEINTTLKEGDIVRIGKTKGEYNIEVLKEETEDTLQKVNDLLQKLQNKNN